MFYFTKNPHNGDTILSIIKNFVNCNFNSDMYSELNDRKSSCPNKQNQNIARSTYTIQKKKRQNFLNQQEPGGEPGHAEVPL